MPRSQNACFSGPVSPDPTGDHPPGGSLADLLHNHLRTRGWQVSERENWRDAGWSIACNRATARLLLTIAQTDPRTDWFLQISPAYLPGWWGRLRSRRASATAQDIAALALDVHEVLQQAGGFTNFRWCWDGPPDEQNSTPQPS